MAYGTVKVDNITFDNGGSDQNVTVSGLYRATTSGVTVSGTVAAGTISGVTVIGSTTVSGVTVTGTTANFTSGNFGTLVTVAGTASANIVSGVTVIGSTTVSGATVTGTTANFTSGNFSNLISAAATMSGALIMANQQQVRFREAVGNGVNHIALQAPAIVSADQTITLPDQTGTVVTTGDNGSVTSTMILDETILNTDISASAAIADTKLATISTAGKVSGAAITSGEIATSGGLAIANTSPRILLTESDGTATHSRTTLGRDSNEFTIKTRSSTDSLVSSDYAISINASGATDHIWAIAGTQKARLNSAGLTVVDDLIISDKIIHDGDTNTAIRFPAADTVTVETNGAERIRINSTGFVFIGSTGTSPNTANLNLICSSSGASISSDVSGGSNSLRTHFVFSNGNGVVGSITTNGSATAYVTSSDYRLKENITLLDGAIARLNQLPVHRFNFIADPDTVVDGFIAHEAAAVVPECVTGEKDEVDEDGDPVYQGIDQSKIVPLLTAALQEAIAKIDALEARIAALEA